jgi:cytochrome c5
MTDQNESPNTPPKPNVVALGSAGAVLLVIVITFALTGRGGTENAETVAKLIEPVARVEVAKTVVPPAAPAAPAAPTPAGDAAPAAKEVAPAAPEPAPAAAQETAPAPAQEPVAAAAQPAPAESAPAPAAKPAAPAPVAAAPAPAAPAQVEAAPTAAPVVAAGSADGKAVYGKICVMCHSTGVSGAPKFGDKAAWAPRIATGVDTLVKNAISGKKLMPAKGGSPTLSEEQIRAAVEYMVSQAQ